MILILGYLMGKKKEQYKDTKTQAHKDLILTGKQKRQGKGSPRSTRIKKRKSGTKHRNRRSRNNRDKEEDHVYLIKEPLELTFRSGTDNTDKKHPRKAILVIHTSYPLQSLSTRVPDGSRRSPEDLEIKGCYFSPLLFCFVFHLFALNNNKQKS